MGPRAAADDDRGRRTLGVMVPSGPVAGLQLAAIAVSLAAPRLIGAVRRGRGARVKALAATAALVGGCNLATALAERCAPFRARWNHPRDRDVALDATYILAQGPLIGVAAGATGRLLLPSLVKLAGGPSRRTWPSSAPLVVRLALALTISELPHYLWHRFSHGYGWRWHVVHHSAGRLYWLNATRVHALDMFVDVIGLSLPLYVLGVDDETLLAWSVFRGTYGKIQHSNVAGRSGVLNHVFSTPDLHRWHHVADAGDGAGNYGASLIVWDRVFGTRVCPDVPFVGEIGVRGPDRVPVTWARQALVPFRSRHGSLSCAAC